MSRGVAPGQRDTRIIGIDLDNTIIDYDEAFRQIAVRESMHPSGAATGKSSVRDLVRALPDGESRWRWLQALVYGREISAARPMPGAMEFLRECARLAVPVFVVSHKSERATADPDGPNLRLAALEWLGANGFFAPDVGLSPHRVYFGATRGEKLELISRLGCTDFIDDLPETFREESFPGSVRRFLLDRSGGADCGPGVTRCNSWDEVLRVLLGGDAERGAVDAVAALLGRSPDRLVQVTRGRNSRVWRVEAGDEHYALKQYFRTGGDLRDRQLTEFGALTLLRESDVEEVPRPVASLPEHGAALYEWLYGDPVSRGSQTAGEVDQAVAFLGTLHRVGVGAAERWTLPASEAGFSIAAIVGNVQSRLAALEASPAVTEHPGFRRLLQERLTDAVERAAENAAATATALDTGYSGELPQDRRTLSPSDFGFHNSVRRPDGMLAFVDFEYFGWDDPAKTVCDFVLHPGMELSEDQRSSFVAGALRAFGDIPGLLRRITVVYPLYTLKWAIILLNEFLPAQFSRRIFAGVASPNESLLSQQLAKADALLDHLDSCPGFPYA